MSPKVHGPGVEWDIFRVKLVQVFTSVPRKSVLSSCLRPGKHPSVEQAWLRGTRTKTLSHLICAQGHIGPVLESAKLDHLRGQLSIGLPGIRPGCLFWDKGQHSSHSPVTVAGCVLTQHGKDGWRSPGRQFNHVWGLVCLTAGFVHVYVCMSSLPTPGRSRAESEVRIRVSRSATLACS